MFYLALRNILLILPWECSSGNWWLERIDYNNENAQFYQCVELYNIC